MSVSWEYYNMFDKQLKTYLPSRGQGKNKAEQLVTAINKLVYKWYNDGDVYDNTAHLVGWANDLSSYANWIYKYIPGADSILDEIYKCEDDSDYEDLLWDLTTFIFDMEDLENLSTEPVEGDIYDCDGPFKFEWRAEDDEDGWE